MAIKELSLDEIKQITERDDPRVRYPITPQIGPLRHVDKEMRCASRHCGSSTFYKVIGMPMCMTHALKELNRMLVDKGMK